MLLQQNLAVRTLAIDDVQVDQVHLHMVMSVSADFHTGKLGDLPPRQTVTTLSHATYVACGDKCSGRKITLKEHGQNAEHAAPSLRIRHRK